MGKTRFAILNPISDVFADSPKKGDLLLFSYQPTEKILRVDQKLSDNIFLVISEENKSYIVYNRQRSLLEQYRKGKLTDMAKIGYTNDKIKIGSKLKISVFDFDSGIRVITGIGTVKSVKKITTDIGSELYKITTTSGIYFVMN